MEDHFKLRKIKESLIKENEELYRNNSKKRLLNNIGTKFKTTMIGALAAFEKRFGHIWENNREWRQIWDEARTEILDLGNKNRRAAEQEISEYTITWNRYQTEFRITQDYKDQKENRNESR